MFQIIQKGSFRKTESYLERMMKFKIKSILDASGRAGANALASATPEESGLAANSWTYEIEVNAGFAKISWHNTDVENGFPVALMLQLGYGTGTGGYVAGRDYINPAMRPVFDKIKADVRKAVTFV